MFVYLLVTSSSFERYSDSFKMAQSIGSVSQLSAATFLDGPSSVVSKPFLKEISSPIRTKLFSDKAAILSKCCLGEKSKSSRMMDRTIGEIDGPLQIAARKIENRTGSATEFYGLADFIAEKFNSETCAMFYF